MLHGLEAMVLRDTRGVFHFLSRGMIHDETNILKHLIFNTASSGVKGQAGTKDDSCP
jgi:hypothetical protein